MTGGYTQATSAVARGRTPAWRLRGLVGRASLAVVLTCALGGATVLVPNGSSAADTASPGTGPAVPPGATLMAGQEWMIKSNDLAVVGGTGAYEWVGCGLTTAPQTASNYTACTPGQVPIYTNYNTFVADVNSGALAPGSTVIFDNEAWKWTPTFEKKHQVFYEQAAAQLAAAHNIFFINTPYEKSLSGIIAADLGAAKYADAVEIQAQPLDRSPAAYKGFVLRAVAAIRKVNPDIPILAGLATDASGHPTGVRDMWAEYESVKSVVQGFWLNADTWPSPKGAGCAPQGCPLTAMAFLNRVQYGIPFPTTKGR
jgi:hypothetical protein